MPDVATRRQLNLFALFIPLNLYIIAVYYATNKRLFPYRNIFVTIAIFAIWETCTNYALLDPRFNALNFFFGAAGFCLTMKLVDIATMSEPLRRKSEVDCPRSELLSFRQLLDAIDYSFDLRGIEWNFGHNCHLPAETRATTSLFDFEVDTLVLLLKHALMVDVLGTIISSIGLVGTPSAGTIFVWTRMPFFFHSIPIPPFITACFSAVVTGLLAYHALTTIHLFFTFFCAPFYSNPAQSWPPLFGSPLHATSVHNFWSYQWHSVLRRGFWCTGGQLGWKIGGGIGAILGAFLVSGLLHDFSMWCLGQGMELPRVTGYFLLQGIVVALEKTFDVDIWVESTDTEDSQKITVRASISGYPKQPKVLRRCSSLNQYLMIVWTSFWIIVPATLMVDAWTRRGMIVPYEYFPLDISPTRAFLRLWN